MLRNLALSAVLAGWGAGARAGAAAAQQPWRESAPVEEQTRPVTLAEVRAEARAHARGTRAAEARAEAARSAESAAAAGRWPTVGVSAGAVRSDDPVAAFGGRLRQGAFTQADFDVARLNSPGALTDWSASAQAMWAPLDLSREAGIRAAGSDATAAGLGAEWAGHASEFQAVIAFLEALAAEERLAAAETALDAAEANLTRVRRRVEEGLLTDADALLAEASAEGSRAMMIDAERHTSDARDRLALAMGWPAGVVPDPDGADLEAAFAPLSITSAEEADVAARPDLQASSYQLEGAERRVSEAGRSRLPRLEGFAALTTHSADPFRGLRDTWTVGVQIHMPLFTGFAISSQERAARAMLDAARLEHEDRVEAARVELEGALRAVSSAEAGLDAATSASDAATEAARLMRRRFEEGLTTVADLLGAEARAAQLATAAVDARLQLHAATARVDFLTIDTTNDTSFSGGMNR